MNERKYTDEEVIEALKIHYALDVPCYGRCQYAEEERCGSKMARDALDLINRQKAEIERLNKCVKTEDEVREIMRSQMTPMVKEITAEQVDHAHNLGKIEGAIDFATMLRQRLIACGIYPVLVKTHIDALLKEFTEGKI